ncbi:hypothetical protein PHYBOEH_003349 [Phytophthora boehmeriae]|uniref:SCP domain-containing protein n=1 Tax=Phytophthora boehmeriae TaxID=109152 RepID=A0A8T1WVK3_9STRA|nr:hypothetical protein PHYBOEH_003349 [Phytophthora boehmeriae]
MKVSTLISFLAAAVTVANADSFSAEDQAIWIDRHNYFRTTGLPWSAGNMRRIGWSEDLAATAATTAAQCSATTAAGVNVFQSSSSNSTDIIDEAIQSWVVETSVQTLKTLAQPGASGVDVGTGVYNSYSQVLWSSTTSVGCASASCSGGDMVVCEYSPAGNDGSSAWYVHTDTASSCPSGTTASQGLCIVQGDAANDQIAAIPAGQLTYEKYPAYVADIQTVLIEAARAIANGSSGTSTGSSTTAATTPTSTTATPTATTTAPTAAKTPTATTATPSSEAESSKDSSTPSSASSKKTTASSSDKEEQSSSSTKKSETESSSESNDDSSNSTKQTSSSTNDNSSPGKVKASSDSGSTFTNQATSSAESSTQQTSTTSNGEEAASSPSTESTTTESAASSTTTKASGSSAAISANNQSSTSSGGGISATGMAGMIVLAIVGVAAFGVVMSYRRNQQRQREIMRDGGIRII